jgi:hypothetical protein
VRWIQKIEDKKTLPKVLKLEREGHKIIARGKNYQVADYEKYLLDPRKGF